MINSEALDVFRNSELFIKRDVLAELVGHIDGFIARNYEYPKIEMPKEIKDIQREILTMQDKFYTDDEKELESYLARLQAIKSYVWEHTPKPHK